MRWAWTVSAVALLVAVPARAAERPNFIVIVADDLGWGDLGCFGNGVVETPRLDQLAQEGTRFTQFYSASPVCSPSRAAFLTGRFPGELRIHTALSEDPADNAAAGIDDWLDPDVPTVADCLGDEGYATAHFGKWHLGAVNGAPGPHEYGFDEHVTVDSFSLGFPQQGQPDFRALSTEYIVDEAIAFIEDHLGEPFFIHAWTLLPHATLDPTPEQLARYDHLQPNGVEHVGARQIYYASVSAVDDAVGRLLDRLDELGLAGDTVVIFTSDNGPATPYAKQTSHSGVGSSGPFRGKKWSLYEGGVRMPLIVRWPGHVPAGAVNDETPVAAVDFLPTLCALAGIDGPPSGPGWDAIIPAGLLNTADEDFGPPPLDGEDMSDVLLGLPRSRGTPLFWEWRFASNALEHIDRAPLLAVRWGDWKLLLNPDGSRVELYDVVADPGETDNRAAANPGAVAELTDQALAWQASLPPGPMSDGAGSNDYPWPE